MSEDSNRLSILIKFFCLSAVFSFAASTGAYCAESDDEFFDDEYEEEYMEQEMVYDPIEPFNRAMFVFNDKLYFWVLKPCAMSYKFIVPKTVRLSIKYFFSNITTPVRLCNCLLQLKFTSAGKESARFLINSTMGLAGLADPATSMYNIQIQKEDFGQTLGRYGVGNGIFICWPFLGSSNIRDTVGYVCDMFFDPLTYIFYGIDEPFVSTGVRAVEKVNIVSLNIGFYEGMKKSAFDPYIFIRDAYYQHRKDAISR